MGPCMAPAGFWGGVVLWAFILYMVRKGYVRIANYGFICRAHSMDYRFGLRVGGSMSLEGAQGILKEVEIGQLGAIGDHCSGLRKVGTWMYLDLQNGQNNGPCTAYTLCFGILGHYFGLVWRSR